MANDRTLEYLRVVEPLLATAKYLAWRYTHATGRPLGLTGEVAEYEAIRLLDLDVCDVR